MIGFPRCVLFFLEKHLLFILKELSTCSLSFHNVRVQIQQNINICSLENSSCNVVESCNPSVTENLVNSCTLASFLLKRDKIRRDIKLELLWKNKFLRNAYMSVQCVRKGKMKRGEQNEELYLKKQWLVNNLYQKWENSMTF